MDWIINVYWLFGWTKMKQYLIIINDGYVESQTFASITLFTLVKDNEKITPTDIANIFRNAAHQYLKEEQYPNDLTTMFSWIMDTIGCFWELLESHGLYHVPDYKVPISKVVYIENIINYITECDETSRSHYFTEKDINDTTRTN